MLRHAAAGAPGGGPGGGAWPPDMLQALLGALHRVMRAAPAAARPLLGTAGALAAAAPASIAARRPARISGVIVSLLVYLIGTTSADQKLPKGS